MTSDWTHNLQLDFIDLLRKNNRYIGGKIFILIVNLKKDNYEMS